MSERATVGMATIGQAPRDDLVPDIRRLGGIEGEILECGALNGLGTAEIEQLAPRGGEYPLVVRLKDGSSAMLSRDRLVPRMQNCVDSLVERGADVVLILCFGEWPPFRSARLVVRPLEPLCAFVRALVDAGGGVGVIVPAEGQIAEFEQKLSREGAAATVVYAPPYGPQNELVRASERLRDSGVDVVAMACPGYTSEMKAVVRQITGRPVVLARSLMGYLARELGG